MATNGSDVFQAYGPSHLTALGVTAVICLVLAFIPRRIGSPRLERNLVRLIAAFLLLVEFSFYFGAVQMVGWEDFVRYALPLHFCGMSVYLVAAALLTRNQWIYEMAYFWGLAGALPAMLAPALLEPFPSGLFFYFFLAHGGILAGVVFSTFGLGLRPRLIGVGFTFGMTLVFALLVGLVNVLLDSNYMFLSEKPAGVASAFFFLDWPWYIAFYTPVALLIMLLLWLPFGLKRMQRPDDSR